MVGLVFLGMQEEVPDSVGRLHANFHVKIAAESNYL